MVKPVRAAVFAALVSGSLAAHAHAAADLGMPSFPAATDEGSTMVWLKDNTDLGVGRFVAFSPDNVLVVLTDEVSTRAPGTHKVSFRQEATRLDFVSRTGGRSLKGSGDVDCVTGSFRADKVELFSGTNLHGDRVASEGPDAAGRVPRSGSAPALTAAQVCGGGDAALAPLVSTGRRTPATVATATPKAGPVQTPEPTPLPPPPRRTPVQEGSALTPPPPRRESPTPPPAPPPPTPAAPANEIVAQIGAFSSRDAAEHAWSRLSEVFPDLIAGRSMRIDTVMVNGAPMYRSAIGGFATPADALALCSRLMASSEACFVRKGP